MSRTQDVERKSSAAISDAEQE